MVDSSGAGARLVRDELIHDLRAQGWTLQAIGDHPEVRLSAMSVLRVLAAADQPADPAPGEPVGKLNVYRYLRNCHYTGPTPPEWEIQAYHDRAAAREAAKAAVMAVDGEVAWFHMSDEERDRLIASEEEKLPPERKQVLDDMVRDEHRAAPETHRSK